MWLAPVDSAPQQEEWIELFIDTDGVFNYSDWGVEVLRRHAGNKINLLGSASPAADIEVFKPVPDRKQHKINMGLEADTLIFGTIMRNQQRKLYPDLMVAFNKYLDLCIQHKRTDLASKSYLYLHVSYPDVGWNIPDLIKEHGLGAKVLVTYICQFCNNPFISFFQDAITVCPHCNSIGGVLCNVNKGVSREQLAAILNVFDVYIQYANCEGFGMPMVEAASCGVPVMAVDYSAMSDVVRKIKGTPLKIGHTFREMDTGAYRVYPDNDACADNLFKHVMLPESLRLNKGNKARQAVEQHYDWNKIVKVWENYFDSSVPKNKQSKWDAPPEIQAFNVVIPDNLNNKEFVEFCIINIAKEPKLLNSLTYLTLVNALNYGSQQNGKMSVRFTRQHVVDFCLGRINNKNMMEKYRCGITPLLEEDYITFANSR